MKKTLKQAVSGLIVQDQRILLIKREKQPYFNLWTLPGGKVKLGESLDDGLKREILEEVGLMVRILPITYVQYLNVNSQQKNYELTTSVCEMISETTPKEAIVKQWFQVQDFFKLNPEECTPRLQEICKELLDGYWKL